MRGLRLLPLLLLILLDPLGATAQVPGGAKDKETKTDPMTPVLDGRTVEVWTKDLINPDPSVREEAIRAMMFFGKEASTEPVVKLLLARTTDQDVSPRLRALQALSAVKIPEKMWPEVIKMVSARLEDGQLVIRAQASLALVSFGKEAYPALPAVVQGARSGGSWEIRRACVHVLGVIGNGPKNDQPPDPRAVNVLVTCLKDPALQVRMEAIYALGALGRPIETPLRQAVETELLRLANDKDRNVSIWAWMSLMCVTEVNDKAVAAVRDNLRHEDPRVRTTAARALAQIGSHARFAVPDLAKLLRDKEPNVVVAAINTLAAIDDPGLEAKNGLSALIADKDYPEKEKPLREYLQKMAQAALDHINKVPKKP